MSYLLTVGISTHGRRRKWLQDTIESMYYYNKKVAFKLVVVDNASKDDTLKYLNHLREHCDLSVIHNSKNLDDTMAMNQILAIVSTKYFLKVDSDVIFCDYDIIDASILYLETSKVSLLGPYWDLSLTRKDELFNWAGFEKAKAMVSRATAFAQFVNSHFEVTMRLPRGNYLLMKTDDIKNIGGFDENYKHNAMEYPLVMKLLESDLNYAEFNSCGVIHNPSNEQRYQMRRIIPHLF